MKPIVTITLNPTIDGSASADVIAPVRKIRTSGERYHPGGGGINVARVIAELGGNTLALYLGGGATGTILDDLLKHAGVPCRRIPIAGYTRIAHTIFERSTSQEYRFVPEGSQVTETEWAACLRELTTLDFDYVVVSGSLPRGMEETAYVRVVEIALAKGARVVLDTSGAALLATLGKGVFLIKPNRRELEDLLGRPLPELSDQVKAARVLLNDGAAELVAITLGDEGAIIVSQTEAWHARAPVVTAHSAVGAGDSFVGAVTVALAQGRSLREILAYGVAAGTAAVLSPGAELSRVDDIERLYAELLMTVHRFVEISAISAADPEAIQSEPPPSSG